MENERQIQLSSSKRAFLWQRDEPKHVNIHPPELQARVCSRWYGSIYHGACTHCNVSLSSMPGMGSGSFLIPLRNQVKRISVRFIYCSHKCIGGLGPFRQTIIIRKQVLSSCKKTWLTTKAHEGMRIWPGLCTYQNSLPNQDCAQIRYIRISSTNIPQAFGRTLHFGSETPPQKQQDCRIKNP